MSPRAMRRYLPSVILCDGCKRPIVVSREEFRQTGPWIYHVLCAAKAPKP